MVEAAMRSRRMRMLMWPESAVRGKLLQILSRAGMVQMGKLLTVSI